MSASRRRTGGLAVLLLTLSSVAVPSPAQGQARLLETGVGGGLGAIGGGYLMVATVAVQARFGSFLFSPHDLEWQTSFIPIGVLAGTTLGYQEPERMWGAALWGTVGWAAGSGLGAGFGKLFLEPETGMWAGLTIGGGLGLLAGAIAGAAAGAPGGGDDDVPQPALSLSFSIGSR